MSTRLLILSDLHQGHMGSLTHPGYQSGKFKPYQDKAWRWFEKQLQLFYPFDVVVVNGDAIDGNGYRNAGVEHLTTNREEQCDMATKIFRHINMKCGKKGAEWWFVRGTPSHTGKEEDWENLIAANMRRTDQKENIFNELILKIENIVFQFKHKVGGGGLPHTITGGIMRSMLNRMFREIVEGSTKANVFVRSHVHRHVFIEAFGRHMLVTPALQFWSGYGAKECDGPPINFGFVVANIDKDIISWSHVLMDYPIMKEQVVQVGMAA